MFTSSAFQRKLTDQVIVLNPALTLDEYNSELLHYPVAFPTSPGPGTFPSPGLYPETGVAPIWGRLEQTAAVEVTNNRDTQISDWLLFLMPDVVISGLSRVVRVSDRVVFEVVGPPSILTRPLTGPHHIEARLVHFSG